MTEKIKNVTNTFDAACNYCIEVMEELSKGLGISYGELNIWLFVIIQPALILLFLTTTVVLTIRLCKKNKELPHGNLILTTTSTILVVAYVIALVMFFLILFPIYLFL